MKKIYFVLVLAIACLACREDDETTVVVSPFYTMLLGKWHEFMRYDPELHAYLEEDCDANPLRTGYIFDADGNRFTEFAACPDLDGEIFAEGVFAVEDNILTLTEDGEFGYVEKFTLYEENGDIEWRPFWNSTDGESEGEIIVHRRIE